MSQNCVPLRVFIFAVVFLTVVFGGGWLHTMVRYQNYKNKQVCWMLVYGTQRDYALFVKEPVVTPDARSRVDGVVYDRVNEKIPLCEQ